MFPPIVLWLAIGATALVDVALCRTIGLRLTDWAHVPPIVGLIGGIGWFYHRSGRDPRIAAMAHGILLWIAFSLVGAILTYGAAAYGGRLHDAALSAADARLGFDWTAWYEFVGHHRPLRLLLTGAYDSAMFQILGAAIVLPLLRLEQRSYELVGHALLALLITTALFTAFPALGPGTGIPIFHTLYIDDLVAMREGTRAILDVRMIRGIISFPSYHAVLATILVYPYRGTRFLFPILGLNLLMLAATPSAGGHYLIDTLAGIAVALAAIGLFRIWLGGLAAASAVRAVTRTT